MELHFGIFLIFAVAFLSPKPASGLRCYECNSEHPGCETNVTATGDAYVKECEPGARACMVWFVQYEYVFPRFFTRSCVYGCETCLQVDTDLSCLQGITYPNGYNKLAISPMPNTYQKVVECMKRNRAAKNKNITFPDYLLAKNAPLEYGPVMFYSKEVNLGNVQDAYATYWEGESEDIRMKGFMGIKEWTKPNESDVYCYSCEDDVPINDFGEVKMWQTGAYDEIKNRLPICTTNNATRILCKKAMGCASLWEVKMEQGGTALSSRIWRGCWHPGDQRCLRRPASKYDNVGRSNGGNLSNDCDDHCTKAYANSRASKKEESRNTVFWHGKVVIETEARYNEYNECRQNVRKSVQQPQLTPTTSTKFIPIYKKPPGDDFFVAVRYVFCGFEDGCNLIEGELDPVQPTPSPPTPPTSNCFSETGMGECSIGNKKEPENSGILIKSNHHILLLTLVTVLFGLFL